jgi:hypothetical protein
MYIAEPLTTLTDYALAVESFYFAVRIGRLRGPANRVSAWLWRAAFIATGIAALVGGSFHGFAPQLDASTLRSLWNITVYSLGAALGFLVSGMHTADLDRHGQSLKWIGAGIGTTLAGLAVQQSPFPLRGAFNQNDAYHLIQMMGLYCFYRGACLLRDRQK